MRTVEHLLLLMAAGSCCLAGAPALEVFDASLPGISLLRNGGFEQSHEDAAAGWAGWQQGYRTRSGEGRNGSRAVFCERLEGGGEFGAGQTLVLDRTNIAPLVVKGWSKAEEVSGSPDSGYSLYVDIIYSDGTPLWARAASFRCGTHDWEPRELVILPEKPVKSLTLHCLFRGHTGRVWFDDVALEEIPTPAGSVMFHGSAVEVQPQEALPRGPARRLESRDGLKLELRDGRVVSLRANGQELAAASPSGFLAREFGKSGFHTFTDGKCPELGLEVETRWTAHSNHIAVEARLHEVTGKDRAITFLFALPVDAAGWRWGEDARRSRTIEGSGEFAGTVAMRSGAAARMSRYPLAAIWNSRAGLALGIDMARPAQYSLVYHPGTKQFYLAYDVALVRDTRKFPSCAEFRFVLFTFDADWGFRSALKKYYEIFPAHFAQRAPRQGIWMPFADVSRVPGFEDFGFAFQEGAPNVAFDDSQGIASFVYVEPMSHWLALPEGTPRTYERALEVLRSDLTGARGPDKQQMAAATFTSGIHTGDGQYAQYLVKAPWCDGGVFSLNPDPELPTTPDQSFNKARVMRDAIEAAFVKNRSRTNAPPPGPGLDGVYFDSIEMASTDLNYRRDHFATADAPLVFDAEGRPCQLMMMNTLEFVRDTAARLHADGRLTFANGVLWNFAFPAPWLDVLGTEINWLPQGNYVPDTDAVMNFRRALSYQKPYCLLLNTDYEKFTPALVERFFQRCLFYGVWPGFFDQDAASKDPYWLSPTRYYERDRELFRKYIPLLRQVTAAGWQPVTGARCDNPRLWLERFGQPDRGEVFISVFNSTEETQAGVIALDPLLRLGPGRTNAMELIAGKPLPKASKGWPVRLPAQTAALIRF